MTILTVGIDLAKNVFAVHGVNEAGKADLVRPAVPRDKLHELMPDRLFRTIDYGIQEVLGALKSGEIDPDDRRWYTMRHYVFLSEVERTYRQVALDGRVLA